MAYATRYTTLQKELSFRITQRGDCRDYRENEAAFLCQGRSIKLKNGKAVRVVAIHGTGTSSADLEFLDRNGRVVHRVTTRSIKQLYDAQGLQVDLGSVDNAGKVVSLRAVSVGEPSPEACVCPQIYAPVCAKDGKTYANACQARCSGASVVCQAACPCPIPIYQPKVTAALRLHRGWNMISVPVQGIAEEERHSPLSLRPPATVISTDCEGGRLYSYERDWDPSSAKAYRDRGELPGYLEPQIGFWYRVERACAITVGGESRFDFDKPADRLPLDEGWNLIGSTYRPRRFSEFAKNCQGVSGPWWYDGERYRLAETLAPGQAYFVHVRGGCLVGGASR